MGLFSDRSESITNNQTVTSDNRRIEDNTNEGALSGNRGHIEYTIHNTDGGSFDLAQKAIDAVSKTAQDTAREREQSLAASLDAFGKQAVDLQSSGQTGMIKTVMYGLAAIAGVFALSRFA